MVQLIRKECLLCFCTSHSRQQLGGNMITTGAVPRSMWMNATSTEPKTTQFLRGWEAVIPQSRISGHMPTGSRQRLPLTLTGGLSVVKVATTRPCYKQSLKAELRSSKEVT